jgi:hypothetical protein
MKPEASFIMRHPAISGIINSSVDRILQYKSLTRVFQLFSIFHRQRNAESTAFTYDTFNPNFAAM